MSEADDIRRVADQIAAQLGERATPPVLQIRRIVQVLGAERAQAFAQEALVMRRRAGCSCPMGAGGARLAGCSSTSSRPGSPPASAGCCSAAPRPAIAQRRHRQPHQHPHNPQ